ncbi:DDB1-and CUL4-associated factor 5 [Ceratobasidium theobromae]|uniref:DDB1-and CUL4-associated factor 5 n=1 Tax=Ceratobasidium theobromae TaxID=1582974 RepID=A0A5N5QJ77_9AGAM|nr:DDB1-and CUL4-associated factor 5 [Ceratobasidium theobromae]
MQYDINRLDSGIFAGQTHQTTRVGTPSIINFERGNNIQHGHEYEDAINSVSTHPTHPGLVMTAGEERLVRLHDLRSPRSGLPSMEGQVARNSEINDAQWCPTPGASHSFVVAEQNGNVSLMDTRMSFSASINPVEDPRNVIQRYATWVSKPGSSACVAPEPSSVAFSSDGMRMAVTLKNFTPVLYDTFDMFPLAQCSANVGGASSPGVGSYANNCTVKHGSFGGAGLGLPEDSVYCAGSDDFRVYAWVIPSWETLKQAARYSEADLWLSEMQDTTGSNMGFTTPDDRQRLAIPANLSQPSFRLGEHRSIVNTAAFHPTLPLIFTSGVESHIQVHSVRPIPGGRLSEPAERTRALPSPSALSRLNFRAAMYGLSSLSVDELQLHSGLSNEDSSVMLFDE